MKKKLFILLIVLSFIAFLIRLYEYMSLSDGEMKIILVYNPLHLKDCSHILRAYESVLEEEGVPFERLDYSLLYSYKITLDFVNHHPALILPDCLLQRMNPEVRLWFENYLSKGGNLMLVYDVGIKDHKGAYLKTPIFTKILGINYAPYDELRDRAYTTGYIKINDALSLGITPGKLDKESRLVKGYAYDFLEYPVARVKVLDNTILTLADVITKEGERLPGMVIKHYKKGKIFYVNLPLGHLKAYSDDLPLRSFLRAFLFKTLHIPHLVNTPYGVGGLVINWHIDANTDWKSIPFMVENGYLIRGLEFSNHITAGDFRDKEGDGLGFDACGKGKVYVEMILPYGELGSHGGWAHNWFSYGFLEGKLGIKDMERYIVMNNNCLESITGYKIREYSAPNGVHPQPEATKILEKLGMVAYYYTGDSGSSPNRTFFNGKMVSNRVIAFPITPYGRNASLFEMWKEGLSEQEVEDFLTDLLNFIARERVIRLFYSHPYDIPHYPNAMKKFFQDAKDMQEKGLIKIKPMSYFADFLLRFLETKYSFSIEGKTLKVNLENQKGLEAITIAIPKKYRLISNYDYLKTVEDEAYRYIIITKDVKRVSIGFISD